MKDDTPTATLKGDSIMNADWNRIRAFVHRRTFFCTAAVVQQEQIRLFPIGSLRIRPDGTATYFEVFARPVPEGASISFLAVEWNPLSWLRAFLKGRVSHPPAIRIVGRAGVRREATQEERDAFYRRVGWLGKTRGGKRLWSRVGRIREVDLRQVWPVRLGEMTRDIEGWSLP